MKKVIRLTESDIHRIVKNSVKKVLTELDWKTYANAARKRAEQGASDYDIYQLDQAANKSLFDKYKMTGDTHFAYAPQIDTRKGEGVYTDRDKEGNYKKKYPHAGQTGRFPQLGYQTDFSNTYYNPIGDNVDDEPYERTSFDDGRFKEMHNDMSNYFKGKSKYVKGKGWQ